MPFLTGLKSLASGLNLKKKHSTSQDQDQEQLQKSQGPHDFPPQTPQNENSKDPRPPLLSVTLPHVHPHHHLALSSQGWTTIALFPSPSSTPTDPLHTTYTTLLAASKSFFALPASQKAAFATNLGSEDGWSSVPREKEFITLRSIENTPEVLRDAAANYWAEAGKLLSEVLGKVEQSLGMQGGEWRRFGEPCDRLGVRTASMLRLFRYEGVEGGKGRVVAEAHRDLGLLSLAIGDTPGREVHDRHLNISFPIEKSYTSPSQTLLVGRQLERLTNGRYVAGGHLVRSYPTHNKNAIPEPEPKPRQKVKAEDRAKATDEPTPSSSQQCRHSIVFVLRAHHSIPINTDDLTTPITGEFERPMRGITARDLFKEIHAAHYNINTVVEEREEQKRRLDKEKRGRSGQTSPVPS